ncbi:hypothetical protein ACIBHY_10700 [Nonomuraea sp. NPDC050547]|uniref:hypothetical protein n=1 Tax=Nonomuraea sp. NPDC050547 TaxID=3364368 RepID=UPI0037B55088
MAEVAKKYDIPHHLFWLHGPITQPPVEYDPATESWNIHGYQEALDIFGDPVAFSSDTIRLIPEELTSEGTVHLDGFITHMDPPGHGKLRKLAGSAFTRKVIADLEPRIAANAAGWNSWPIWPVRCRSSSSPNSSACPRATANCSSAGRTCCS